MRGHSGRLRASVAGLAALALVVMSPASSSADENPIEEVVGSVVEEAQRAVSEAQRSGSSDPGSDSVTSVQPSSDDDSEGHETADPQEPDHGQGTVADAGVAGEDLATVGDSRATVEDDDSTKADATLLALGGEEIFGAHADSEGTEEEHFGDPLGPLCEGSEGQVCLRLLYADAWATDDGSTSESRSRTGVADVCLGGDDADPEADCTGPVSTGVATSEGEAQRDQSSGRTTAASESDVADVCVEDDPATEGCALGATVLHSEGQSDSGGAAASTDRESYLLALEAGGEELGRAGDPQDLSLPPGCPTGESLLCLFLNQGESYVGTGTAGHAQEALHLDVLPGNLDLVVELSRTETLVHNDGGESPTDRDRDGEVRGVASGGPGAPGAGAGPGGILPDTGGVWSGLLALALLGVGGGALLTAYSRRRVGSLV